MKPWRAIRRSIRRQNSLAAMRSGWFTWTLPARAWALIGMSLTCGAARAGIDIEIVGVTEPIENNVRAFLSVTRYADRDDLTDEIVSRIERRIPAETREALQPLGYYSPSVSYQTTRQNSAWKMRIEIDAGRAVRLSEVEVTVEGDGAHNESLRAVLAKRELKPGARLDHGVYEKVKVDLLRTATSEGYLDARLTRSELIIDPTERRAFVKLALDTGARYYFGHIDVTQPVLRESKARRLLRMREGDPYTTQALLESQYILDDSQYFTGVELAPGQPDAEAHTVPLAVRADRNKRNAYALSAGYGTDTRLRGKLTWDNRYVNRRGHRSQVELVGSAVGQSATVKYIVPVRDIALEKLEFNATAEKQELADIISRRVAVGTGLTQALGDWQRVAFLTLSSETDEAVGANSAVVPKKTFLVLPGVRLATLPPSLLDPEPRRYSVYAELSGSPESLGSDATFLQLRAQGERVFDLSRSWHVRTRGQIGATWSSKFATVPASHRFFAGGDNSIRGFGLNELSPIDPLTGVRVGGRHLLVASLELERDLPRNFGAAAFVDGGNAFDHFSDPLEYSVGVGGRYRLASVASLGLDVAQALSQPGWSPTFHLRLTTLF